MDKHTPIINMIKNEMMKINTNINEKINDRKIQYNPNGKDWKMNNKVI